LRGSSGSDGGRRTSQLLCGMGGWGGLGERSHDCSLWGLTCRWQLTNLMGLGCWSASGGTGHCPPYASYMMTRFADLFMQELMPILELPGSAVNLDLY
jgi:hypothetical protein